MRRYGLRDDQWNRIKNILPGREGHVDRLFVEAVLFRFRVGVPWRFARALWRLEDRLLTLQPMGQERRLSLDWALTGAAISLRTPPEKTCAD